MLWGIYTLVKVLTSQPAANNSWASWAWPFEQAHMRQVHPSLVMADTLAPKASRRRTIGVCPSVQASCRAVTPLCKNKLNQHWITVGLSLIQTFLLIWYIYIYQLRKVQESLHMYSLRLSSLWWLITRASWHQSCGKGTVDEYHWQQ